MKRNDNTGIVLATLLYHEQTFALTGGALRRIVYLSTNRQPTVSGWTTGFTRLKRSGLISSEGQPVVHGHATFVLTDKGRERLGKMERMPRAHDVDPDAFLSDAHRFVRATLKPPKPQPHGPCFLCGGAYTKHRHRDEACPGHFHDKHPPMYVDPANEAQEAA